MSHRDMSFVKEEKYDIVSNTCEKDTIWNRGHVLKMVVGSIMIACLT